MFFIQDVPCPFLLWCMRAAWTHREIAVLLKECVGLFLFKPIIGAMCVITLCQLVHVLQFGC